ncbi:hypothetical protein [Streptomyces millisiae]|uniref:Uncharacterized protein n=1 Tax=Streptomyces millisiae TaxID=3075542 RepID=A0ABU2LU88_9ACTN|nr:hypothetical protein [Streptomyces sp. DSM 44918]MDT0321156.1 hypothetical protein [Streptomyces sp. DSM 44918]
MPNGDLIHFRSQNLTDIQTQTTGQQERYIGIWDTVRTQIMALVEQGLVDAQVGGVLAERDQIFRREATGFDDSVIAQNTAVRNVQNIGVEGGAAMVRAARGGA